MPSKVLSHALPFLKHVLKYDAQSRAGKLLTFEKPYVCFFVLALAEVAIFSISFNGYFYGDSVALLYIRPRTLTEALASFTRVDMWYRPLSIHFAGYLLVPIFGQHFAPYHALNLALHLVVSALIYLGFYKMYGSPLVAVAGSVFFGVNCINFYTTYDFAFLPELSVTLFYLLAIWQFYNERFIKALCFFVLALFCKESAITLPLILAILILCVPRIQAGWRRFAVGLAPMGAVAILYVAFYGQQAYLSGGAVTTAGRSDYLWLFDQTMIENAGRYLHWSFQIPDSWLTGNWLSGGPWLVLSRAAMFLVAGFAFIQCIKGNRRVIFGVMWFAIAALPTLPLSFYLIHHAYLPLIGISLLVSESFSYAHERLPRTAFFALLALFCLNHAAVSYHNVRADAEKSWVGEGGQKCKNAAQFVKSNHTRLTKSSIFYIIDTEMEGTDFSYQGGNLFRWLTGQTGLTVKFVRTPAEVPTPIPENTLVAKLENKKLVELSGDDLIRASEAIQAAKSALAELAAPRISGRIDITADGLLTWKATGPAALFVSGDGNPDRLCAEAAEGSSRPEWLMPGHTYRFTLRDLSDGTLGGVVDSVVYRKEHSRKVWIAKPVPATSLKR